MDSLHASRSCHSYLYRASWCHTWRERNRWRIGGWAMTKFRSTFGVVVLSISTPFSSRATETFWCLVVWCCACVVLSLLRRTALDYHPRSLGSKTYQGPSWDLSVRVLPQRFWDGYRSSNKDSACLPTCLTSQQNTPFTHLHVDRS